jgi:hypothetical protein
LIRQSHYQQGSLLDVSFNVQVQVPDIPGISPGDAFSQYSTSLQVQSKAPDIHLLSLSVLYETLPLLFIMKISCPPFSRLCFCPPFFSVILFFEEFLENFDQEGEKRGFFYFLFFLFSLLFPCLVSHYTDTHLHVLFLDLFLSEDHHYSIHEYS